VAICLRDYGVRHYPFKTLNGIKCCCFKALEMIRSCPIKASSLPKEGRSPDNTYTMVLSWLKSSLDQLQELVPGGPEATWCCLDFKAFWVGFGIELRVGSELNQDLVSIMKSSKSR
jgi:hypothetical protein